MLMSWLNACLILITFKGLKYALTGIEIRILLFNFTVFSTIVYKIDKSLKLLIIFSKQN